MDLSDYVLDFLTNKKVKKVFLITGGAISFLVDAFSRTKKINYISVGHEQAAAMMADSYSRLGPNFSCTMVTSGPGATNLLTGIACSYFDSVPSLHICGQVNTYEQQGANKSTHKVRQVGFQETDIVSIAKPITKFAYKLKHESEIKYILEKSYHLATTGRPGPVLIDIPMDLQRKKIIKNKLKSFNQNVKLNYKMYIDLKKSVKNLLNQRSL
jgi:acetolactate synthase-1/2/3 large subunit